MKLVGKRIYLIPWTVKDAKALQEMCNDETIGKFTRTPYPYTIKSAKKFIKENQREWKQWKTFSFAVKLKKSQTLIGSIALMEVNKEHKRAVLGYLVHINFRRKGFAVEAGKLILKFAFKKLKLHRIEIYCLEENKASKKVIEKLGAKFEGIQREKIFKNEKFHNRLVYAILEKEFKPGN